jgi:peptidyl-prolyl cis-trans isomerase D
MLQDIRKSTSGPAAKIIIGLIVISFSIFGIESILLGGGTSGVAEVNGEEISPLEVQQLVNIQKRRLLQMMGGDVDPSLLDDQVLGAQALESLIDRKLLTQTARELDLVASDRMLGAIIGGMEQFQVNGQFSPELYRNLLSTSGFTPAGFKQNLAQDIVVTHLRSGLAGSEFVTPAELQVGAVVAAEQRDLRYLIIPVAGYYDKVALTGEQIDAFYTGNQQQFVTREKVDLDYIELTTADFIEPVDEATLREEYEIEKSAYQYQTERRVSHILFEQGEGESDDAYEARIAAAEAALADGAEFAELAATVSDDIGSAAMGGDLGFTSGDTFPDAMEEAIASLAAGERSRPVVTDAGTHLILVTEVRQGEMPVFEELRPDLERRVQEDQAQRELLRMVESLKDLVFNAESLDGPAAELGLTVQAVEGVVRGAGEGLFGRAQLQSAMFSAEVLDEGHNSDVLEVAEGRHVVVRVRRHYPPQVRPLEEVREQIVARLTELEARRAAEAEARAVIERLRQGESVEAAANALGYDWQVELGARRDNANVPPTVLSRAFTLPAPVGEESVYDTVTSASDVHVVELFAVVAGDAGSLAAAEQQRLRQQLITQNGQLLDTEFQQALRERADITIL